MWAIVVHFGRNWRRRGFYTHDFCACHFHYRVIEIWGAIRLSGKLYQSTGPGQPKEANRCVIFHLRMGFTFAGEWRKRRLPDFTDVRLLASTLRIGYITSASEALERIAVGHSVERQIVQGAARDRAEFGHGRDCRPIPSIYLHSRMRWVRV